MCNVSSPIKRNNLMIAGKRFHDTVSAITYGNFFSVEFLVSKRQITVLMTWQHLLHVRMNKQRQVMWIERICECFDVLINRGHIWLTMFLKKSKVKVGIHNCTNTN